MVKTSMLLVGVFALAGMTLASHGEHDKGKPTAKTLSAADIAEKIDGKKMKATTFEVTLELEQVSAPHRHPGPVFGYVLEGENEWAIDDRPAKSLRVVLLCPARTADASRS